MSIQKWTSPSLFSLFSPENQNTNADYYIKTMVLEATLSQLSHNALLFIDQKAYNILQPIRVLQTSVS